MNYQNFYGSLLCTFFMFIEMKDFKILKNLRELSVKVVDTKNMNNIILFTSLVLILFIVTTNVERVFSTMNYVKTSRETKWVMNI